MRVLQGHTAGINGIAVYKNKIYSASEDKTVRRWDNALSSQQQTVNLPSSPISTTIAPDGNSVAVGFKDGSLRLYSLPKSNLLWENSTAHSNNINRLAFNSDGTLLASASSDTTAKLWQVKNGKLQQTFIGHKHEIHTITFSPDDHVIATASYDAEIGLFTVGTEQKNFYRVE
jgi:WD40 repeat protein